jgi:hypothetical protein
VLAIVYDASVIELRRHAPIFPVLRTTIVGTEGTDCPVLAGVPNQTDKLFLFG